MNFQVSMSARDDFARCEQKYYYRNVSGLRKRVPDLAPERGSVLHAYIARYYEGLRDGQSPSLSHEAAKELVKETAFPKVRAAANTARMAGDVDLAIQLLDMPDSILRIADRYYAVRGKDDATYFRPILVEERVSVELVAGIESVSVIDLVLEDVNGLVWLVEHKTSANIPNTQVRVMDFQTLLYAAVLPVTKGIQVDGVLWNYLRTKEPSVPEPLKNGGLSRSKMIDSTWEVYLEALQKAGQDPSQYQDMKELLGDREITRFFPRYQNTVMLDTDLLMRDYVTAASRMRAAIMYWESGHEPVRTITRDCQWCPYYKLCEATLTGGDTDQLIQMYFTTKEQRNKYAD